MLKGMEHSEKPASIFEPIRELEHDLLGRLNFARQLLDRLSEPDCSPTLGLYGGWGVGKTSILNLILTLNKKYEDEGNRQSLIEYIDVWPYEVSGDLTIPLLVRTRKLIGGIPPTNYAKSWRRILGVLAQAGADLSLRYIFKSQITLEDVKGYGDNLEDVAPVEKNIRDLEKLVDDIQGAQDAFKELIQLVRNAHQDRRIVFLIDNLDRCSPENVVRLLESIKNFLSVPDCTWVFAMDSGVIASYIDKKYEDTKMDGNSYLDKIIPEQYHIPPVSMVDMARMEKFLSIAIPKKFGDLPSINLSKIPHFPEVLVPRRLLKTAHRFYRAYSTPSVRGTQASPDTIFALILLYNSWPAFYERFSSESAEHVEGILENYKATIPNNHTLIPLPQKFLDDRSLAHYINYCFIKGQSKEFSRILAEGMVWLREVGLP